MTVLTDVDYSAPEVARALDVSHPVIWRFARQWYAGGGYGSRFRLTRVDVMVCRAWVAINKNRTPTSGTQHLLDLAEMAIRAEPRRWLYLCGNKAATFDHEDRGDAAVMWLDRPSPRGLFWLIDLLPWEEAS